MKKRNNTNLFNLPGHSRPTTRREFLGRGLISGMGIVTAPSLLGFLSHSPAALAQAAECGISTVAASSIPFLVFDLGGGANIAGSNVLVGGPNGQMDFLSAAGYSKLGLPADMTPEKTGMVDTTLGLAFHAHSAMLTGIKQLAQPDTLANTNGCIICARSENDTANNPLNPMYGLAKAGANGNLITLIGTSSSESGGRSRAPASMVNLSVRPTKVSKPAEASGIVNTGKLSTLMNPEDALLVMKAVEQLSAAKVSKITETDLVKNLLTCGYSQTTAAATQFTPASLDPTTDADITRILGTDITKAEMLKVASVMKLVVGGFAGAGTIELGGFDYHNSTRATGELRDLAAGRAIGAALEYAKAVQKPLMIYVFSDGAVDSNGQLDTTAAGGGKGVWKGDNSLTAAAFFLVYNPLGRPQLANAANQQLGFYKPTGTLETTATPISNNVEQLTSAIVLNYMALNDDVARFAQVLPNNGLGGAANLDKLIAFAPIV